MATVPEGGWRTRLTLPARVPARRSETELCGWRGGGPGLSIWDLVEWMMTTTVLVKLPLGGQARLNTHLFIVKVDNGSS